MFKTVAIMFAAMSLIPAGDAAGKLLMGHGVQPMFVAWSRFAVGVVLAILLLRVRMSPRTFADWRIWLRGGLVTAAICSILTALRTEQIATVYSAFFVGPLLSYFLSAWLLKERLSMPRIVLLLVGFCGVVLAVRPGFGMTPGLGFAVLAGCFYGCFLVASRWLKDAAPASVLLISQLAVGTIVLAPFGLAHLPAVTVEISALVFASAAGSMFGNLLLIFAYARAEAGTLAPFVYFQLIAATLLGVVIFGDIPDLLGLAGLALLLVSGFGSLAFRPVVPVADRSAP